MNVNFPILLLAALVPMLVGFIWYHPKVFGTTWLRVAQLSEDKIKGGNMVLILGLTFLFSLFIAMAEQFLVIHQYHVYSILIDEPGIKDPNSEVGMLIKGFMDKYGNNFRTFKHGVLHGVIAALMLALPVLGINALFERKGFKYIALNTGYWIVTLGLMGGIICAYA